VATVSALTGISLLVGATAGALLAAVVGLKGQALVPPTAIASGLAAGAGVWAGVRISERFARRSSPGTGHLWPTVGGIVGLVAAVAIASRGLGPWAPLVVILLPGLGALLGDALASRRAARQRTVRGTPAELPESQKVPPLE
jgi:uncharacterized membrane protein